MKIRHFILIFLALLFVGQIVYYYPLLPQTMASHFDGNGTPNGWMEKSSFLVLECAIFGLAIVEFLGLPLLIDRMPDSMVSLPNKEYWLAPERRAYVFEVFRMYFQWFSVGLLTMLVCVNQLVYRANITKTNFDSSIWLILAGFFAFAIIWLVRFVLIFRKTT